MDDDDDDDDDDEHCDIDLASGLRHPYRHCSGVTRVGDTRGGN